MNAYSLNSIDRRDLRAAVIPSSSVQPERSHPAFAAYTKMLLALSLVVALGVVAGPTASLIAVGVLVCVAAALTAACVWAQNNVG